LIGPWWSFLKTTVIPILLGNLSTNKFLILSGAIFGAALTFRQFKGVLWYAVPKKKKLAMVAIANICMIPSWVFFWYQFTDITFVQRGANMYIMNALHFLMLYFVLFGVLPKKLFTKMNLLNQKSEHDYYRFQDELVDKGNI